MPRLFNLWPGTLANKEAGLYEKGISLLDQQSQSAHAVFAERVGIWGRVNMETTGYDCDFVDDVPKEIQSDCSICLLILREPFLVQCCGNRFCRACLERITKVAAVHEASCPLCKQTMTAAIHDKQLERTLKEKVVYCSNKASGCTWTGELGQLEEGHLKANPPQDQLMDGCPYVQLLCPQCKKTEVQRHAMKSHVLSECPRRMAVCTYCKKYRNTYDNIVSVHHLVCPHVPEPCPKGCGAKPLRKNISNHLAHSCPKNSLPCPFRIVGCTEMVVGSRMEVHLWDSFASHLSSVEKAIIERDAQLRTLTMDIKKKDLEVRNLTETNYQLNDMLVTNECHLSSLRMEVRDKEQVANDLRLELERSSQEATKKAAALEKKAAALEKKSASLEKKTAALETEVSTLSDTIKEKDLLVLEANKASAVQLRKINALSNVIKEKEVQIGKLKDRHGSDEHALRQLKAELQKCSKPLKTKIDTMESKHAELQRYSGSLETKIDTMKSKHAELQRYSGSLETKIDTMKSKHAELQRYSRSLETKIESMASDLVELEDKAYMKALQADTLEIKVAELREVIHTQQSDIDRLTRVAERKLSEVDKREERHVHGINDKGSTCTSTTTEITAAKETRNQPRHRVNPPAAEVNKREERLVHEINDKESTCTSTTSKATAAEKTRNQQGHRVNPPAADDGAVLGAALGIAVGVGIAGVAALLRR